MIKSDKLPTRRYLWGAFAGRSETFSVIHFCRKIPNPIPIPYSLRLGERRRWSLCCASEMHILSCDVTMMKSFEAAPRTPSQETVSHLSVINVIRTGCVEKERPVTNSTDKFVKLCKTNACFRNKTQSKLWPTKIIPMIGGNAEGNMM